MKNYFMDRLVEYPNRFNMTQNEDDSINLDRDEGNVVQDGTVLNAANLNSAFNDILNLMESIISGSPDESFTDVSSLTTKYPTGDEHVKLVLASSGVKEVDTLTVTAIPNTSGNVTITLNGVATTVALSTSTHTTTDLVASAIRGTSFSGWVTSGTGSTVIFTKSVVGTNSAPTFNAGTTGAVGSFTITTTGQNARTTDIYYWNGSSWVDAGPYLSGGVSAKSILSSMVRDNGIDYLNLDGRLNVYNQSEVTTDYRVTTSGSVQSYTGINVTGYTRVRAGLTYEIPSNRPPSPSVLYALYDNNKNLLSTVLGATSGVSNGKVTFTPSVDGYVICNFDPSLISINGYYIKIVSDVSKILEWLRVQTSNYLDDSVTIEKVDFMTYGDIFTSNGASLNYTINSTGGLSSSSTANTSVYLEVKAGVSYPIKNATVLGMYDGLKTFVSRKNTGVDGYTYIPSSDGFIRVTYSNMIDVSTVHIYDSSKCKILKDFDRKSINASAIKDVLDFANIPARDDSIYLEWNPTYSAVYIYMKATKDWLKYAFAKKTRNSAEKASGIGADPSLSCTNVWQQKAVYVATKNDNNVFTTVYPSDPIIHSPAEWETAIKTYDYANNKYFDDFVGGYIHGDEVSDNIVFMLDGQVYTDPSLLNGKVCRELRIFRTGSLYLSGTLEIDPTTYATTSGTKIANHYVDYLYKNNTVTINQNVDWIINTKCAYSCLAMLGVKRTSDTNHYQISNKGLRENEGIINDISVADFTSAIGTSLSNVNKGYAWNDGTTSGNKGLNCSFAVEVLDQTSMSGKNFKISNHDDYNKFYFGYCQNDQAVTSGDRWHSKALYEIDYKGAY